MTNLKILRELGRGENDVNDWFKNAMRVCAAELICSTGVLDFQTFKPVFCKYNKLCFHAEIFS